MLIANWLQRTCGFCCLNSLWYGSVMLLNRIKVEKRTRQRAILSLDRIWPFISVLALSFWALRYQQKYVFYKKAEEKSGDEKNAKCALNCAQFWRSETTHRRFKRYPLDLLLAQFRLFRFHPPKKKIWGGPSQPLGAEWPQKTGL